jgi:hypothetical protein
MVAAKKHVPIVKKRTLDLRLGLENLATDIVYRHQALQPPSVRPLQV